MMYFIHTTCPWKQSTIYWIRFISWSFDASWWKCTQSSLPSVTSIATYSRVKERTWNIAQSKVPCLSVNVFVFEPVFIYCIILCSRKRDMQDCTEHGTLFIWRVKSSKPVCDCSDNSCYRLKPEKYFAPKYEPCTISKANHDKLT